MYQFLPWWILGAPVVLALIDWARTPKVRTRSTTAGTHDPIRTR